MLEYSGIGFENRAMVMPKPEWLEMKKSLGFDFPNLPYYQVNHGFDQESYNRNSKLS